MVLMHCIVVHRILLFGFCEHKLRFQGKQESIPAILGTTGLGSKRFLQTPKECLIRGQFRSLRNYQKSYITGKNTTGRHGRSTIQLYQRVFGTVSSSGSPTHLN